MRKFLILLILFPVMAQAQFIAIAGSGTSVEVSRWVSPTSKENDAWTDAEKIYDGSLITYGTESTNGQATTLLISVINCTKVRIYAGRSAGGEADLK